MGVERGHAQDEDERRQDEGPRHRQRPGGAGHQVTHPHRHLGGEGTGHRLTERQFLDAVAMGLITPGPVVISATFIGYLVGGLVGALVATLAIFTPIYLGVVVPGRWFIGHRDNAQVKAFVKGATAAAAGAIAGATVILTRQAVVDVPTGVIAVLALAILLRFKVREPYIVAAGAVVGLLLH